MIYSTYIQGHVVVGGRLRPLGRVTLIAASRGKEPTRMSKHVERVHQPPPASSETKLSWKKGIALGLLSVVALSGCTDKVGAAPGTSPTSTTTATGEASPSPSPSKVETVKPTEAPKTREQRVKELEIKAGLSAEQFGQAFADRISLWEMSGATEELWKNTYAKLTEIGGDAIDAEVQRVAKENVTILADGMFVSDWKDTIGGLPKYIPLQQYLENEYNRNWKNLLQWARNHKRDGYPDFESKLKMTGVSAKDTIEKNGRVVLLDMVEVNNAASVAKDLTKAQKLNDEPFCLKMITKVEDGLERIGSVEACGEK